MLDSYSDFTVSRFQIMFKRLFPRSKDASFSYPEEGLTAEQQNALTANFQQKYQGLNDPQAIFDLCKDAASQGVIEAIYLLGVFYETGDGQQHYYPQAVECYKRCVDYGHQQAQYNLALIYAQDKFGEPNFALAYTYFTMAAESGLPEAQYNLACFYDQGLGCLEDKTKAFEWFMKAATNGFARACQNVAVMYYQGEGVDRDMVKAYAWTLFAAKQGVEEAVQAEKHMTQELREEHILLGKELLDDLLKDASVV